MAKITDQVTDLTKRVGALESADFNDASGVARIVKVYGNIRITATISARLHTYWKVGQIVTDEYMAAPFFPTAETKVITVEKWRTI